MKWLKQLRRLLPAFTAPPPPPRTFTNPLDYVLAASLDGRAVLPAELQAQYPDLAPAAAAAIPPQLVPLHELAMDLGSLVNRQVIDQHTAYERLFRAYPQLDRPNLGRLLWQAFVGTR